MKELIEKMRATSLKEENADKGVFEVCAQVATSHFADKWESVMNLPFDVKYLANPMWKPRSQDTEEYKEQMALWEKAQEDVLFKNVVVHYESCDCGGEYGCNHPSYPYRITFTNSKYEVTDGGDQWQFEVGDGIYVSLTASEKLLLGQFIKACELVGIELLPPQE